MLENKTVMVTGGSRGIGAEVVRYAIEQGAHVAFTYRSGAAAALALAQELGAQYPGQSCVPYECDVADTDAMQALCEQVLARFRRVDALVNNAGITRDGVLARMTREQWDTVIDTNLTGLFNATRPMLLPMIKQGGGAIVNLTSIVAIYGIQGQANYAAAKGGIIGFTKALSAEVAPRGIRVNAVAPGYIATDMSAVMTDASVDYIRNRVSLGRLGTARDVAPVVCFLASDLAAYITGQIVQVDGGVNL